MQGQRTGGLIGAVGGLLFVLVNASGLPPSFITPVRGLGLLAFLAVLWWAVLRPAHPHLAEPRPSEHAWQVYWKSVLTAAVALLIGANVLSRVLHQPKLSVLWVIFVVGAHFLPFARSFGAPVFRALAWTLMALALCGVILTLGFWPAAPSTVAVLAGFVLLGFSGSGGRFTDKTREEISTLPGEAASRPRE